MYPLFHMLCSPIIGFGRISIRLREMDCLGERDVSTKSSWDLILRSVQVMPPGDQKGLDARLDQELECTHYDTVPL